MTLPNDSQRVVHIGRTGSGKTTCAAYMLSLRAGRIPWIVLNFKEDELLNGIPGGVHVEGVDLPRDMGNGVFIMHPEPDDYAGLSETLSQVWRRRNVGVFVDEAYMLAPSPQAPNKMFRRLLIQGRSLNTPLIICTQQPSQIDSHVFTESEFFNVFALQGKDNKDKVMRRIGDDDIDLDLRALPRFHSYWYDHIEGTLEALRPVPTENRIYANFAQRLTPAHEETQERAGLLRFIGAA